MYSEARTGSRSRIEKAGSGNAAKLVAAAREILAIAGAIDPAAAEGRPLAVPSEDKQNGLAAIAAGIYHDRRLRDRVFGNPGLFGEPTWDLLLDLYVAQHRGKDVSISSACIAASVPQTTGLRYLARLERGGLVVRRADPQDGRRALLQLTDGAVALIERSLAESFLAACARDKS